MLERCRGRGRRTLSAHWPLGRFRQRAQAARVNLGHKGFVSEQSQAETVSTSFQACGVSGRGSLRLVMLQPFPSFKPNLIIGKHRRSRHRAGRAKQGFERDASILFGVWMNLQ